jgi:hypothetical protein
MIRQSVGRATLRAIKPDAEACKERLIKDLCRVLQTLLPVSFEDRIQAFVSKIVETTVALRDCMTQEQAIFRCFFLSKGDTFDEDVARIASGEEATGKIKMCVFPGLKRLTTRTNNQKQFVTIVKATVNLEAVSDAQRA